MNQRKVNIVELAIESPGNKIFSLQFMGMDLMVHNEREYVSYIVHPPGDNLLV